GKKYKPTPTEQKDPEQRKIVIMFEPEAGEGLIVPVIFSLSKLTNGKVDAGFAILTDDPPADVSRAGHDRCPIILGRAEVEEWLAIKGKTARQFDELLGKKRQVRFSHKLDELVA